MRVDIQPQWKKLANWYWSSLDNRIQDGTVGMSIWEMLEHEYGAIKVHSMQGTGEKRLIVDFPDEKFYTWFLLKWG